MSVSWLVVTSGVELGSIGGIRDSRYGLQVIITISILAVPIMETLLGQLIPIHLCRFFTRNTTLALIASTMVFCLLHVLNSPWYILITIPAGILLAGTYLAFIEKPAVAFWITAACHCIANLWSSLWIVLEHRGAI